MLLECKQYEPDCLENADGLKSMNNYPYVSLYTLYQLIHYDILKDGGNFLSVLVQLLLCVLILKSDVEMEVAKYQNEDWYGSYEHFIQDIQFDITDFHNIHDHLQ